MNKNIKELYLEDIKFNTQFKKVKLNILERLTLNFNSKIKFVNFQKQFPNAKYIKVAYSDGIRSNTLKKMNQLSFLEIVETKDRSLGFQLPKEKNSLKYLRIENSKLWWPPKNLGEYINLDTLVLDVAFYRKKRLKKALLNLPNLKYVRITNWRTEIKKSKKLYQEHKGKVWVRNNNTGKLEFKKILFIPAYSKSNYTLYEIDILDNHPNKKLDLYIEAKWKHDRVHQH